MKSDGGGERVCATPKAAVRSLALPLSLFLFFACGERADTRPRDPAQADAQPVREPTPASEAEGEEQAVEGAEAPPESSDDSSSAAAVVDTVPAGTRLFAAMDWGLSRELNRSGDHLTATLTRDLVAADSLALLVEGTRLLGQVRMGSCAPETAFPPLFEIAFEAISTPEFERGMDGVLVQLRRADRELSAGEDIVVHLCTPLLFERTPTSDSATVDSARVPGA